MAAPEQSGAPPDLPPLVTQPRSGARMTQVLVSLNTLGLEMNRQVMTVRDFISERRPLNLSGNMGMLKVARSGFCLQTDIHARQLKLSELGDCPPTGAHFKCLR